MATLTITFSAAVQARLRAAFEKAFELDRPATADDVRDYVIRNLKQFVTSVERRVAREAAQESITDPNFT